MCTSGLAAVVLKFLLPLTSNVVCIRFMYLPVPENICLALELPLAVMPTQADNYMCTFSLAAAILNSLILLTMYVVWISFIDLIVPKNLRLAIGIIWLTCLQDKICALPTSARNLESNMNILFAQN